MNADVHGPSRRWDAATIVALVVALGAIAARFCGLDPGTCYDVAWTAAAVSAVAGTWAARRTAGPANRERWTLWTVATGCWLFGQAVWDLYGVIGFPADPNLADVSWWAFAVLVIVSVLRFPRTERSILAVAVAESIPLVCAAISLCLALLWRTDAHSTFGFAARVSDLTYPCVYASATVLTLQAMLGGALRDLRTPALRLVLGGTAAISVAFMLWSSQLLRGTYVPGTSVLDPLWVLGLGAIGVGGLMTAHRPERAPALTEPSQLGVLLPAGLFVVLFAALVGEAIAGEPIRSEEILVLGLLCSGAALIVRSMLLAQRMRGHLTRERRALARLVERESDLARLNEQLIEDSRHDALTGLGNRRALSDDLAMFHSLQRETDERVAVLLCDVDHFKAYNDRFGHLAGDQALCMIAASARGALRVQDSAYRFGGEEFLIVLRDVGAEAALTVAERVRLAVEHAGFAHPAAESGVLTVSIGLADGPPPVEDVLARADTALYEAKEAGRNRSVTARLVPGPAPRRRRSGELEDPTPHHLRGMLSVSRAAASGQGLMPVLQQLAEAVRGELGFNVVAVNLRESPDLTRVVTVLGEPSAQERLLDTTVRVSEWSTLAAAAREVHGALWLPAGSYEIQADSVYWRADTVAPLAADGWDPDDMLLLPLRDSSGDLLGVISVDQPLLGRRPTDSEIGLLMAVVDHAGLAVEQIRQHGSADREESAALRLAAVMLLAETLDLRDPSTALHSRTVGRMAHGTAVELGLAAERVERVRAAGVLHDLGKLGIADAILHKPGPLDDAEWREMRRHPEIGARILEHAGMKDIAAWVRAHHERIDGHGYPRGLTDGEIPIESRILSVADSYEAMIADRPYRRGMPPQAARDELERCAGTQFDPAVVVAFLRGLQHATPEGDRGDDPPGPAAAPAGAAALSFPG